MKLTIVGTGYVGLVTGACLADVGHNVTCMDTDGEKINSLLNGEITIFEPGLDSLVAKNVASGRLSFTQDLESAMEGSDVVFIAVGTPSGEDGSADLKYVKAAIKSCGKFIKNYTIIVNKSTVPVGTGGVAENILADIISDELFDVVSNPEFLREGAAIKDFAEPDRIVVGANSERAKERMAQVYKPLTDKGASIFYMERTTAELVKYASNAFLATKIGFINEMADLCECVGADVTDLAKGMGSDKRIGDKFLSPGPGYGGSCFPKDTLALLQTGKQQNVPINIVSATVKSNNDRKIAMADKIEKACDGSVDGKVIAILGLTFKANTDDMRDSPSLVIVPELQGRGAKINAYDPEGMPTARPFFTDVNFCSNTDEALKGADAMVILTEWECFKSLDFKKASTLMAGNIFVDLRNLYINNKSQLSLFRYTCIGKPAQH